MDEYLQIIKQIVDLLASIQSTVFDVDLVTLTLNGLDENYHA